jgi:CheY-like chemotaxis protein
MNPNDRPGSPEGGQAPIVSDRPGTSPQSRFLVVDDDPIFQLIVRTHLEEMGFTVAVADNGKTALKLCPQFKPSVVILDMFMPEKEGIETIPALKRIDPAIEILAISGGGVGGRDLWLKTARLLGARHVLKKPFSRAELAAALAIVMQPREQTLRSAE